MDRAGELISQNPVDGALPVQARQSGQLRSTDLDMKMALPAIGRTGMPGMQRAFIGDGKLARRECRAQLILHAHLNFARQLHLLFVAA